jgi:hypothetical protein
MQSTTRDNRLSGERRVNCARVLWTLAASSCWLAVASMPAAAQISFQAQPPMAAGSYPAAVAVGDFDRDGNPDLAVIMQGNNRVYLYSGDGSGSFHFTISYLVGSQPSAIVATDLNHDGKLDLAVTNRQDGTVSILLGNGNATFSAAVAYAVGALPNLIVADSFDPDGFVDLVTANTGDACGPPFAPCGSISLLRNNGDGTFYAGTTLTLPAGDVPSGIASGVFTAGGDADLVVTSTGSNEFIVYLGDGGGGFPVTRGPFATLSAGAVVVADFNHDGKRDLAIARWNHGDVSLQLGNGDGTFQAAASYGEGTSGAHAYSAVDGDFDGDGFPDLALANFGDNSVAVLRDRPLVNGGFDFDAALTFTGGLNSPRSIAVGDFNRDGKPDFVVVNDVGGNLTVFLNTSTPIDHVFADGFE